MHSSIKMNVVHLWYVILDDFIKEDQELIKLLSEDEIKRAERFRFRIHREYFIVARAFLRKILNLYTQKPPQKLSFLYGEHGKPYLSHHSFNLHFNVSHSHNVAIFAITSHKEVGVDIEKVEPHFNETIAERFFTMEEYQQLILLPKEEQVIAFYKIWSRKEALIKALGGELYKLINKFTVDLHKNRELITFNYGNQQNIFHVETVEISPAYQCAIAMLKPLERIELMRWEKSGISAMKK